MFKKLKNGNVALALIVIIAVVNLPLQYVAYRLFYVEPYLASLPEAIRPIANYEPFFRTWYGGSTIGVWLALVVLWVWHLFSKRKITVNSQKLSETLIVGLLCLLLYLCIFQIKPAKCEWNVYREVDVLMIGDEEFRAHSDWITNAENVLSDVSENRFDQSYINFYVRGWLAWDSLDSQTGTYSLMQEALAESGMPRKKVEIMPGFWDWGFISGSEWTDPNGVKWWIDLLLIFTGQNCDIKGLSLPMLNMTILRYDSVDLHTLTHELGHQYYLEHCSDPWCVMNVDWQFGDNFCDSCRAKLTANRNKWLTDPEVFYGVYFTDASVEPGYFTMYYDGQNRTLKNYQTFWGWGGWLKMRCGTQVTIYITPYYGYALNYSYALNAPPIFAFDPDEPPPITINFGSATSYSFYMNDTWSFLAFFYHNPPVCAMKTLTNGYFYMPYVATDLLKIEMLFDNQNLTGDQTGGTSPYSTITAYPDGSVDMKDVRFVSEKFGLVEGQSGWNYMADLYPDRKIDMKDTRAASKNFGKSGTYITDLTGVKVTFNTGEEKSPDSDGFVVISQGATSFTVKRNGTPIGAMVIFW